MAAQKTLTQVKTSEYLDSVFLNAVGPIGAYAHEVSSQDMSVTTHIVKYLQLTSLLNVVVDILSATDCALMIECKK